MNDSDFVTLRGGLMLAMPRSLDLITPYVLREQQDWFEDELKFLRQIALPGWRAVDIGANYGVYALTLALLVGDQGQVTAVEPASDTLAYLRRSITQNNLRNLRAVHGALSNCDGQGFLCLDPHAELSRLQQEGEAVDLRTEQVPLFTLDRLAEDQELRDIDFLKIDAEGEEARIIEGGRRFLQDQSPLLMFEVKHGATVDLGLLSQLADLGYVPYRLVPGLNLLVPLSARAMELDPFQLNLFACKDDRAALLEGRGVLARKLEESTPGAPQAGAGVWQLLSDTLPCHRQLRGAWARIAQSNPPPGAAQYKSALDAYTRAHWFLTETPAGRYRALQRSYTILKGAILAHPSLARLQSLARVAWEIGQREESVKILNQLAEALCGRGGGLDLDEPFLPVSPRFDTLDPAGQLGAFCLVSVLEQRELLRAFSSYYTGTTSVSALQAIVQIAPPHLVSDEIQRRLRLVQERAQQKLRGA